MSERATERDEAFTAFVADRGPRLLRYCLLLTGSQADAEDLLQASLLKAYLHWSRINEPAAAEAYVRSIITRTHVSTWRKVGRHERPSDQPPERPVAPVDVESADEILRGLERLGERQRAVVVLRFYEDQTEKEIARLMGTSIGTVKSQLSRGLANLRGIIESEGAL